MVFPTRDHKNKPRDPKWAVATLLLFAAITVPKIIFADFESFQPTLKTDTLVNVFQTFVNGVKESTQLPNVELPTVGSKKVQREDVHYSSTAAALDDVANSFVRGVNDTVRTAIDQGKQLSNTLASRVGQHVPEIKRENQTSSVISAATNFFETGNRAVQNFWGNFFNIFTSSPKVVAPPIVTPPVLPPGTPSIAPVATTTVREAPAITQIFPVRERVVERIVERTVPAPKQTPGVSQSTLDQSLNQLSNALKQEIYRIGAEATRQSDGNFAAIALTQRIDKLNTVAISNATITNSSFAGTVSGTGGAFSGGVSGTTGTFSGALTGASGAIAGSLTAGTFGVGTTTPSDIFALNGPAYIASTTVPVVTTNRLYNSGGNLYWANSMIGGPGAGNWTLSGPDVYRLTGNVGIGTTTPYAKLSVEGSSALGNSATAGYFTATTTTNNIFPNVLVTNATTTNATSTSFFATTASSTNLYTSNFSLGGVTGFLKGVAGSVGTALVNLASDITGTLGVSNGGTGWANIQSGAIPYGNGVGALATTTQGTGGQILSWLNGIPSWTATTTFSSGLAYSGGNVINTGVLSVAQTYGATQTGAILLATSTSAVNNDWGITNTGGTFTFNIPTATALVRGLLSGADWTTFNNKQTSSLAKGNFLVGSDAGFAQATSTIFISSVGNVGIGTTAPTNTLEVNGTTQSGLLKTNGSVAINTAALGGTYNLAFIGHTVGGGTWNGNGFAFTNSSIGSGVPGLVVNGDTFFFGNSAAGTNWVGISANGTYDNAQTGYLGTGYLNVNNTAHIGTVTDNASGAKLQVTGNANITGNVGIGTTGPLSKLDVSGGLAIGSYAGVNAAPTNGLIVSGNVGIATTTPWGLLSVNPNAIGAGVPEFVIGSSTATHLVVTGGGNVGIGTTGPLSKLDVNGGVAVGSYAGTNAAPANGLIVSGNVGIGATAPSAKLQITGADSLNTSFAANVSGATGTGLVVTNANNVGIGTAAPTDMLHVYKDANANVSLKFQNPNAGASAAMYFQATDGTHNSYFGQDGAGTAARANQGYIYNDSTGVGLWAANAAGYVGFYTGGGAAGNEKMRITAAGNVGIGTTNPQHTLDIPNFNTTNSQMNVGTLETQAYSLNNAWIGENTYFDGTNFRARATGAATLFYFYGNEGQFRSYNSVAAGTSLGNGTAGINLKTGTVGFGVGVNMSPTQGNYTGSQLFVRASDGNVGIGTTGPLSKLDVNGGVAIGSYAGANAAPANGLIVSGNVGIGTAAPNNNLQITYAGNAGSHGISIDSTNNSAGNFSTGLQFGTFTNPTSDANNGLAQFVVTPSNYSAVGEFIPNSVFYQYWGTGKQMFVNRASAPMEFLINGYTSTAIALNIDTSKNINAGFNGGSVGIGLATAPTAKLQVVGADSLNTSFAANISGATGTGLVVTNAGNLGVGTAGPLSKLDVSGGLAIGSYAGVNAAPTNGLIVSGNVGIATTTPWGLLSVNPNAIGAGVPEFVIGSSTATHLVVTGGGNVGIGTTAPNNTFQVAGLINFPNIKLGTFLGYQAGNVNTGYYNTFVGYQSGLVTASPNYNTALGAQTLFSNTFGNANTALGAQALYYNVTGSFNTASGYNSLINSLGDNNTASGYNSLFGNTTGNANTGFGNNAGRSITSGSNNTFLGASAGYTDGVVTTTNNLVNSTAIGYNAQVTANNSLILGGVGANSVDVGIGTTAPSASLQVTQSTTGVGTVSNLAGGTTVTGVGTQFTNTFKVGDTITIPASSGQTVAITAIASDTSMTTAAITLANSGVAYSLVGGNRFAVLGNGNVGVGTVAPQALNISGTKTILDINSPANLNSVLALHSSGQEVSLTNNAGSGIYFDITGAATASNNFLSIRTTNSNSNYNPIEAMRITSAGNVGIATTTPWRTLSVVGTMAINGLTTSTAGNAVCITAGFEIVTAGNTSCVTSSLKTKENILAITSDEALHDILGLVPSVYTNRERGDRRFGFIAEQANTVDPRIVEYASEDRTLPSGLVIAKGDPSGFDYLRYPAVLTKFVQDLYGNVKDIASQVGGLITRVASLEIFNQNQVVNGITTKDRVTGEEYCVFVSGGTMKTTKGACASTQTANVVTAGTSVVATSSSPIIISIQGNNPATINVNDRYGDLGALITAPTSAMNLGIKASVDGGVLVDISQISVDTSVAAVHHIVYTVVDQNNATTTAERILNVVSLAPPPATVVATTTVSTATSTPVI